MEKLKVGVLGAGEVGMKFVRAMDKHPHFEIVELYGNRSAGKKLEDVVVLSDGNLEQIRALEIKPIGSISKNLDLICSALPSDVAKTIEGECATHTPVISTASAYRYDTDVPVIITEVNAEHYHMLALQRQRGWNGWVLPGPNCTTVGLVMSLYPLYKELNLRSVIMVSEQSVSGAGRDKLIEWNNQRGLGLPMPYDKDFTGWVIEGNVIPYIEGEEEKVRKETAKILGNIDNDKIKPADIGIDCTCKRVAVPVGHLESVFVETQDSVSSEQIKDVYLRFNEAARCLYGNLPSSPQNFVTLVDVPQPRLHVNLDGGMTAVIGRIEPTKKGFKYEVLSNNLQRGAAKGSVHVAEHLYEIGFLKRK